MNQKTKFDLKKLVFLLPAVFTAAVVFGMLPRTEVELKEIPERIQITEEETEALSTQTDLNREQGDGNQSPESVSAGTSTGESASADTTSSESASADTTSSESASADTTSSESASADTISSESASADAAYPESASIDTTSPGSVSADTDSSEPAAQSSGEPSVVYPDGIYTGHSEVYDEEDDEFYYLIDITITVKDGKIVSLDVLKTEDFSDDPDRNEKFMNIALNGTKSGNAGLIEQIISVQEIGDLDAVSGATYTSEAILEVIKDILPEGESADD